MPDNPFNAMLNPDKQGTITGFIGGLMGNPTASQAAGGATSQALQELSALRDQGLNPQQSLMKFFQSPAGHDYFVNAGPDGLKQLTDGLTSMQPPAPTLHNVPAGGQLFATNPGSSEAKLIASNPKEDENFTLSPGSARYGADGRPIANNPAAAEGSAGFTLAPGATRFGPNGQQIANNPATNDLPSDVKSFNFYTQLAGLPADKIKELAAQKATGTTDPNSVTAKAIDGLVANYGLDPRLGQAMKAGQVKVIPLTNEVNQQTGDVAVIDLTNPNGPTSQVLRQSQMGGANPAATASSTVPGVPQPAQGTTPSTGARAGVLPPAPITAATPNPGSTAPTPVPTPTIAQSNPKYFGSKSDMFLGSGAIAKGLAGASGVSELVNPKMIIPEGAQAEDRQDMIDTLRSDLAAMGQQGGGFGVNKGVLEGYLKLAPTGGVTESPHQAIQRAIRLAEHIDTEITSDSARYADKTLPMEERKGAASRIEGWNRVKRDLPSMDEMRSMEEAIRSGTAGAPTVSSAVNTVVNSAGKVLTEGKRQIGEVQSEQGLTGEPNIDAMSDPKELLAVNPQRLSRTGKIKLMRKLDSLRKAQPTAPQSR